MYKKNPNNIKCPIHGLHYDQRKQDGCALCLREAEERDKRQQGTEKKSYGLWIIVAVSLLLGFVTWASLQWFLPPPKPDVIEEEYIHLTYDDPVGWTKEDVTGRLIALDRMGLHAPKSPWSMQDRFSYHSKAAGQNHFIEYIQILRGPGAYFVNANTIGEIQKKLKDLKPTSIMHPMIVSSELVDVADTKGVLSVVSYQSDDLRYQALVYYIPGSDHHYWVMLAAQAHEWERHQTTFDNFIASLHGGKQGKETSTHLPGVFRSPHRSIWAGMIMFLLSLWVITLIVFRKERQRLKRKANFRREADNRHRHILKD